MHDTLIKSTETVNCSCFDNDPEDPCRHCPMCGRFVSDITLIYNDDFMVSVHGNCKTHGKVNIDMRLWQWENFGLQT